MQIEAKLFLLLVGQTREQNVIPQGRGTDYINVWMVWR